MPWAPQLDKARVYQTCDDASRHEPRGPETAPSGAVIPNGVAGVSSNDAGFITTCVRTETELHQLQQEWMELFYRIECENVFLSFDWMVTWWYHWGEARRLFVVAVRHPTGRLVALAPLCIARSAFGMAGLLRLGFLGDTWGGADYLDILVESGYEAAALGEVVRIVIQHRREWDYMEFSDSNADSPALAQLRRQLKELGMNEHVSTASECPYTALPDSFEQYLGNLGPNVRYNFRRRMKALERKASLAIIAFENGAELQRRFGDLVRLHRLRSAQLHRKSSFLESGVQAFHADVLPQLARRGWARLYVIQAGGGAVAALYGFSIGKKFLFYQSGMDPAWSRLSVGLVMMGWTIAEAIRNGHKEFDFLRGDEPYKFRWANSSRQTLTVRLFDRRPKSRLAQATTGLAEQMARGKSILKQWHKRF
jgi:CelD/BcsL family acetyltransferase involved in cellulose biosynthesis